MLTESEAQKGDLLRGLGAQIRLLRIAASLTIKELAEKAELSPRFLIQLESGRGNISIAALARIAAVFQRPVQELIPVLPEDESVRSEVWRLVGRLNELQLEDVVKVLSGFPVHHKSRFTALIGVRGSGKSTVGPLLAECLDSEFVEVDSLIERTAGMPLSEIFQMHGEQYYRRLERQVLNRLFSGSKGCVLAAGGSVVTDPATWELVKQRCFTIWLQSTPEEYIKRVRMQGDMRPMRGKPSAMAELRSILALREPLYSESDLIVKTTHKKPAQTVSRIMKVLNSSGVSISEAQANGHR